MQKWKLTNDNYSQSFDESNNKGGEGQELEKNTTEIAYHQEYW